MGEPSAVTVTTGARLHFGLCSHAPTWGGAGVMIDRPVTRVTATRLPAGRAADSAVLGPEECLEKAAAAVRLVRPAGAAVTVEVEAAPRPHAGFGSGTQLTVAAATAVARLFGEPDPIPERLALQLGRGARSRLGAAGFRSGGLLLDPFGALAAVRGDGVRSVAPPPAWRWLIVVPKGGAAVSGDEERAVLADLPDMAAPRISGLRRIVKDILPLAAGAGESPADAALFARALGDYGSRVGRHFAAVQGGVYAHPLVREWAADRRGRGAPAPVQSSWGPTAAALHPSAETAAAEADHLAGLLGDAAEIFITPTRARGADIVETP